MTNVTPPMIIGGLAVLTTAIAVIFIMSGLWTVITGRDIVWKRSPRLRIAELVGIVVYARLKGKSTVQIGLKLLARHLSTGRRRIDRRKPQFTRAYGLAREVMTNMLPMQETPAPRRTKRAGPATNLRHTNSLLTHVTQ